MFRPLPTESSAEVLPEAMPAARLRMLPPDTAELVPMAPTTPSPLLPSTLCHWMPNSASLLAVTSTIRLSTSTCARRPSSLSITARSCRYWGSGAVMMSELVVGSAWICPPVEGWLLLALLEPPPAPMPRPPLPPSPALLLELLADAVLDDAAEVASPPEPEVPAAAAPLPPPVADMAARSVVASLVASAFLRYTTWMLPLAALLPGTGGWSSLSTSARTWATRAGLAARRIRALLRGSAISVVLNEVSLCPWAAAGAAALPPSISRATSGARSAATAFLSGITSTSLALETSMAATMRARRCRLSA